MKPSHFLLMSLTGCALYATDTLRAEETPAAPPAADPAAQAPDADAQKSDATQGEEAKPEDGAAQPADAAASQQAAPATQGSDAATNVTAALREKLAQIDVGLSSISKPSSYLVSSCNRVKQLAEKELKELDEMASKVTSLTEVFNNPNTGDFVFTKVTNEDRDKYLRDAQAAYKAFLTDMNEKKGRRKVAGLDKFEVMRERYQGVEEYKQAYEIYLKTLKQLEKHWNKMLAKEEKRRARFSEKRTADSDKADEKLYQALAEELKEGGDDITKIWYNPTPTNLYMLKNCTNKLKDALRRSELTKMDEEVGKVPQLIEQFWQMMDTARQHMINGEFEAARKEMRDNEAHRHIARLRNYMLPNEYRDPMMEQYRELEQEITKRERTRNSEKRDLDRAVATLERKKRSLESRLVSILESIDEAKARDVGHDSAVMLGDTREEEETTAEGTDTADPTATEDSGEETPAEGDSQPGDNQEPAGDDAVPDESGDATDAGEDSTPA